MKHHINSNIQRVSKNTASLLLALLAMATVSANAERLSISWFTIDGGGGASTGGVYSVTGTIGQPDAGKLSGSSYSVVGGFWSVIQSAGRPHLKINMQAANVVLSWPADAIGFTAQSATQLTSVGANWTDFAGDPVLVGDEFQLVIGPTNTPPNPIRFFRLKHP